MSVYCPVDGNIDGEQCRMYHCTGMRCGKLDQINDARMRDLYLAVTQLKDEFDVRPHLGAEGGYMACKWAYSSTSNSPWKTIIADGIGKDAVEALINLARELQEQ